MTPKEFNIIEYSKAFISRIEHWENKNVLFIGFDDIDVISEIINQKYKNCNIYIVDNKETCDCISILDLKANIYVLNSYNEENNYIKEVFGPLNFYDDILISIWKNGASITTSALKLLKENGICICSMLMSNYKKNELYRHVETFELANPKLFKDAEIGMNLCITTCKKTEINKYSWTALVLESVDPKYKLVYEYNILHFDEYKLYPTQKVYITKDDLDVKADFIDSSRVFSSSHGAIPSFRKQSDCYKYNTQYDESCINKGILVIKFTSEKAKQNYCKFAYNYETLEERNTHLCGKLMKGLRIVSAAQEYYFFIPQIDWGMIHISQKELWDKGDYDNAVLAEMGLKFDENGVIVKC